MSFVPVIGTSIKKQLEDREDRILSPYAARNSQSHGRRVEEEEDICDIRLPFQRDRDRIIHSKTFRRLKHKTQVFLSPSGDHYRTRLTHSLEVSQIGRTVALALGAVVIAGCRRVSGTGFDRIAGSMLVLTGLVVGIQELLGVAAALASGSAFNFSISLLISLSHGLSKINTCFPSGRSLMLADSLAGEESEVSKFNSSLSVAFALAMVLIALN